jgi:hypothetical protein
LFFGFVKEKMMSKERELLERWLDDTIFEPEELDSLMEETRELLAQPEQEQEPVAWMQDGIELYVLEEKNSLRGYVIPLYTAPPKREPLSDDVIWDGLSLEEVPDYKAMTFIKGIRFAEKQHGIRGVDDE